MASSLSSSVSSSSSSPSQATSSRTSLSSAPAPKATPPKPVDDDSDSSDDESFEEQLAKLAEARAAKKKPRVQVQHGASTKPRNTRTSRDVRAHAQAYGIVHGKEASNDVLDMADGAGRRSSGSSKSSSSTAESVASEPSSDTTSRKRKRGDEEMRRTWHQMSQRSETSPSPDQSVAPQSKPAAVKPALSRKRKVVKEEEEVESVELPRAKKARSSAKEGAKANSAVKKPPVAKATAKDGAEKKAPTTAAQAVRSKKDSAASQTATQLKRQRSAAVEEDEAEQAPKRAKKVQQEQAESKNEVREPTTTKSSDKANKLKGKRSVGKPSFKLPPPKDFEAFKSAAAHKDKSSVTPSVPVVANKPTTSQLRKAVAKASAKPSKDVADKDDKFPSDETMTERECKAVENLKKWRAKGYSSSAPPFEMQQAEQKMFRIARRKQREEAALKKKLN